MEPKEYNLITKIQSGDKTAMGELYESYHSYIKSYFIKHFIEERTADDLTQQVFERVLLYNTSFKYQSSLKTWLYSIANNIKIDSINEQKKNLTKYKRYSVEREVLSDNDRSPYDESKYKLLHQALDMLNEESREIIVLGKLENLDYEEISSLLNISVANVKVRVFRAMKLLKQHVELLKKDTP